MSCICQYVINSSSASNGTEIRVSFGLTSSSGAETEAPAGSQNVTSIENSKEPVSDDTKIAVCVSELANFRAENWLLKKKLHDYEVTIENLEELMSTIVNKQHQVLNEMIQLRKRNNELETECNLQREYHVIERNTLIKELHELKELCKDDICPMQIEGEEADDLSETEDSQEYERQLRESDSDDDCRCDHDSDEDGLSAISSFASTGPSSINSSPDSTVSDSEDTEYSEEDAQLSQHEEYSSGTQSESD